jgi:DNA polymerase-3 subunit delta'
MAFAHFPEQAPAAQLLQRAIARGRLAHAYLFAGSRLAPLEDMAITLAKTLNCQNRSATPAPAAPPDSCDRCSSCRKTQDGLHPDVQWLRPESKLRVITIDQVRELIRIVNLKPTEGHFKIAVLVAADRLNPQAANALLKTLEEPPPRSVLLLLSEEPQRLLETILSRCLRLNFPASSQRPVDTAQSGWLTTFSGVAATEHQGLLARYRLLGALLCRLAETRAEVEKTLAAHSPLQRYADVDPSLASQWEEELSAAVEAEYRRRRADLLLGLHWWLRDVWLRSLGLQEDLLALPALRPGIDAVAARITPRQALENLRVLERTQRALFTNAQEALALEVGLLSLNL